MSDASQAPVDRRSLTALLSAHTLSQTGNAITVLATPFYVITQGGTGVDVAIASASATVPIVLGGPLSAILVDRIGHRISSVIADVASGVTVLAIAALASLGILPFWAFLLLIFASGLLDAPGNTARNVLLPALSIAARVPLSRSVSIASGAERAAMLIGAPLGGLLVAAAGAANAFFVTTLFFAAAALLVLLLVRRGIETPLDGSGSGYWRELAEGFSFVAREPLLRMIVLMVLLINLLDSARFSVLLPLYAAQNLQGAAALGLLTGVLGGSALLCSLLYGFLGQRLRRRPLFVVSFALCGVPLTIALAAQAPLPVLVAMTALTGLASGALNPIIGTLRLELAPPAMRARVQSVMISGCWAGIPIGALLGGLAADNWGLPVSFLVVAVLYLAASLLPLRGGPWKRMDEPVTLEA